MERLSGSLRDAPPTHFRIRIESFSTLSSSWSKRYESCVFSACDYKWQLALYPNGNKMKDGEDHISLYLVLAADSHAKLTKEILVLFNLLLFDHVREKYFSVQEVSRFDAKNSESGFDKFLPLKIFIDPANGYLVNDTCTFGADVFILESTTKEHCLSMMPSKPAPYKHTWKVEKFTELEKELYRSEKFTTRGHDWEILLYPKGNGSGKKTNSLSLFLKLADSETLLTEGREVLAEYTLRLVDQVNKKHKEMTGKISFCASRIDWGYSNFVGLRELNLSAAGYLLDDACIIEAEVTLLGSAKGELKFRVIAMGMSVILLEEQSFPYHLSYHGESSKFYSISSVPDLLQVEVLQNASI